MRVFCSDPVTAHPFAHLFLARPYGSFFSGLEECSNPSTAVTCLCPVIYLDSFGWLIYSSSCRCLSVPSTVILCIKLSWNPPATHPPRHLAALCVAKLQHEVVPDNNTTPCACTPPLRFPYRPLPYSLLVFSYSPVFTPAVSLGRLVF